MGQIIMQIYKWENYLELENLICHMLSPTFLLRTFFFARSMSKNKCAEKTMKLPYGTMLFGSVFILGNAN